MNLEWEFKYPITLEAGKSYVITGDLVVDHYGDVRVTEALIREFVNCVLCNHPTHKHGEGGCIFSCGCTYPNGKLP